MSVDKLQEKIRKLKNPSVLDFNMMPEHIPPHIREEESYFVSAYEYFCTQLLQGLKGTVPAVRFSLGMMSLYGPDGLAALANLLRVARSLGYYILLDSPNAFSTRDAVRTAELLLGDNSNLEFDGLITSAYIGSDGLRPICERMKDTDKDLFVLVRTANKTAPELQDLLTGSRLVHIAAADVVNRLAQPLTGRSGYSRVAAVAAASAPDSAKLLRSKYKSLFLLLDGYDYPNANAKNCSAAFDALGHGAAACAGTSITAAWQTYSEDAGDFVRLAVEAAERMRKNLTRYVTIL